ncbi:MAG: polyprenyl synthetase family protein [Candidatus Cloacimonetes bacterium]|nr:polyprenyl synthetase family protein [Candidatus Cloacimonadota bacterium]MBL7108541.1 polyprenyl synthetase family protein [Candidatus Cloacimonadota bacterium]
MILERYFDSRKKLIEKALNKYLSPKSKYPQKIHEAMRYSIFAGGKRLRPLLLIATYEMLIKRRDTRRIQKIMPLACAIEMIHTASLIHDDLPFMDDANVRRGKPSCHKKFGNAIAILAGDALITKSFETILKMKKRKHSLDCLEILLQSASTRGMIGGQVVELLSTKRRVKLHVLRDIHLKKTGALLRAAEEMACVVANANEQTTSALSDFALNVGLAYQVIDDILDEIGADDLLEKETGEDSKNNRVTYPVLLGIEESKKQALKLIHDARNIIKYIPNNSMLLNFLDTIQDRVP